jgi:hypothetical protein
MPKDLQRGYFHLPPPYLSRIVRAMTQQGHLEKVLRHAEERLVLKSGARPTDILNVYKKFLKVEEHRLRLLHHAGGGGREIAQGRAQLMDVVLRHVFKAADENFR